MAATLVDQLRSVDLAYRYGGEEFLVLLPEQTLDGALPALDRVRLALVDAAVEHRASAPLGLLTLSIGVTGPTGGQGDARQLLAASDAALYRAKRGGRNRVCRNDLPHSLAGVPRS